MIFLCRKEERIGSLEEEIKQRITQLKRWGRELLSIVRMRKDQPLYIAEDNKRQALCAA